MATAEMVDPGAAALRSEDSDNSGSADMTACLFSTAQLLILFARVANELAFRILQRLLRLRRRLHTIRPGRGST